ncbi:uncharacterized protein LOC114440086 [Parambassis ranga]|uniref:Uncharacterized protein LOC114440086 n=1 Tax=Parambassis ranga TaxID=210632 RepID=A0A6P7IS68_9TELE|nr:uncharacterized protein LOC114440086 [Parambassis ranga]
MCYYQVMHTDVSLHVGLLRVFPLRYFSFSFFLFFIYAHKQAQDQPESAHCNIFSSNRLVTAGCRWKICACGSIDDYQLNMDRSDIGQYVRDLLSSLEEMEEHLARLRLLRFGHYLEKINRSSDERRRLIKLAEENCRNHTVLQWLRENSESDTFIKLVEVFNFLKKHIDEEEKKNHGDHVDITFVAHGAIRDFMIPASCLLPLPTITDVVLYAPWNCVTTSTVTYAIATGKIRPEHRVFYCDKRDDCKTPDEKHRPINLPNHWNSMKMAGDQMIPNIIVSPLQADDGVWKHFKYLTEKHGELGRNKIIIPFILPDEESDSVPFSVVTLALSLVLLTSRFTATVHFDACLGDRSAGQRFDKDYLQRQYACAIDNTGMTFSTDMLNSTCTLL